MNKEVIRNLQLAHKYQKEAFFELLPKEIRENARTIDQELQTMTRTCLKRAGIEIVKMFMCDESSSMEEEKQSTKVKKVEID